MMAFILIILIKIIKIVWFYTLYVGITEILKFEIHYLKLTISNKFTAQNVNEWMNEYFNG